MTKPPLTGRAWNFARSGVRVISAIAANKKIVRTQAERDSALAICSGGCDKWDGKTCNVCGCFGAFKTWLETEHCPLGKW